MLIAIIPLVVLVAGLLMWVLAANPKVSEAGRLLFFCGAFVLTWKLSGETFRLG
jgi:Na+/phosphate symporter